MKVNNFLQIFDINDKSEKDLLLKGVNLGTYRNDILCKWYATQEIQIGDFEKYICRRLQDHVGYPILTASDVMKADLDCRKSNMTISSWMQNWMILETREELLPHE